MRHPTLSVIVPTTGRRGTLFRTLASIRDQPGAERIEVLLVGDGFEAPAARWENQERALRFFSLNRSGWLRSEIYDAGHHCWGHCQRNYGMQLAEGAWLAFLDDDDCWTPDAGVTILSSLDEVRPHIFRMRYPDGGVLWRRPRVELGNVGTPMFVVPSDGRKLGRWGCRYEGDLDFIRSTLQRWPGGGTAAAWHRDVIALIGPVS